MTKPTLRRSGTYMINIRVEHALDLDDMVSALVMAYISTTALDERPEHLAASATMEKIRKAYAEYGRGSVWAWTDNTDEVDICEWKAWAGDIIVGHWPELARPKVKFNN